MVTKNPNWSLTIYIKGLVMLDEKYYHPKASYIR